MASQDLDDWNCLPQDIAGKKTPYILTMKAKFLGHFVELDQSESSNENWAGLFLFHGYKKRTIFSVQEKNGQNTTSQLTMCFLGEIWAMPSHRSAAMASFLDVGAACLIEDSFGEGLARNKHNLPSGTLT